MYCPKCNRFYKKKYGVISKCACGYNFVFGKNDIIKDRFMLMLEKKASKNETRYFTMDNLYNVYQKHQARHSSISKFFRKFQILDKDSLAQIHYHWQTQSSLRSHKFIDKPNLQQPKNPIGEEVFHYGVERIIVVDEPLKVDLFVKNNKHVEKKALIISSDGYPAYLKSQLQNILEKQPDISIGFLYKPESTIDIQKMHFEKNYQVKLSNRRIWDMIANQRYKENVQFSEKSNEQLQIPVKKSQDKLQPLPSIEPTASQNSPSWLSWLIPSATPSIAASVSTEKETEQNDLEIDTDNIGVDTNSSGIDDMSDFSDDGGFDGVDDNDDDGGDDSDDDDGDDSDDDGDDDDDGE